MYLYITTKQRNMIIDKFRNVMKNFIEPYQYWETDQDLSEFDRSIKQNTKSVYII